MSASPCDLLIHPAFRDDCRKLEVHDLTELDMTIFRLRTGEIQGLASGDLFELVLPGWIIFYGDETIRGRRRLTLRALRPNSLER